MESNICKYRIKGEILEDGSDKFFFQRKFKKGFRRFFWKSIKHKNIKTKDQVKQAIDYFIKKDNEYNPK